MLESCLKKSGADFSISCARLSCWTITYVKRQGIEKKGKINTDTGRFINVNVNVNVNAISEIMMKIIIIAKTELDSVKIDPLNKNSCNLDKCFSGRIFSKNIAKLSIILNFIKITLDVKAYKLLVIIQINLAMPNKQICTIVKKLVYYLNYSHILA